MSYARRPDASATRRRLVTENGVILSYRELDRVSDEAAVGDGAARHAARATSWSLSLWARGPDTSLHTRQRCEDRCDHRGGERATVAARAAERAWTSGALARSVSDRSMRLRSAWCGSVLVARRDQGGRRERQSRSKTTPSGRSRSSSPRERRGCRREPSSATASSTRSPRQMEAGDSVLAGEASGPHRWLTSGR